MKRKLFATILFSMCSLTTVFAQKAVEIGYQITSEDAIEEGMSYVLQSQAANTPYIADAGSYYNIPNNNPAKEDCVYQFISNGNGTWKIKSVYTGKYWGIPVNAQFLAPAAESAAGAWSLNYSSGVAIPTAPDANNVTRGLDRSSGKLYVNSTNNSTKQVKIYKKKFVDELDGKVATVSSTFANNLEVGQWYVMFDRGTSPKAHGYLYENFDNRKLFNTATAPQQGTATSIAHYLVRLKDAGEGKYYLQTGVGNYFGEFTDKTQVPVVATAQKKFTIAKIANTNGHFYVQSTTSNVVLNANDVGNGDATVVGWGTTVPTAINGNNDWAFYPVTLEEVDESVAIFEDDVTVTRGYQTCGRGNENSLMLRIDVKTSQAISDATFTVNLNAAAQDNLSSLYIHETTATEFIANIPSSPIGTASSVGTTATINIGNVSAGTHHFWLCATVKNDAELGKILEASLKEISYTCLGKSQTLDVSSKGTLSRQGMKVFDRQNFVFKPTTDGSQFYRIPAMLLDKDGNIVVAADKRYTSNSDLGNHRIDVVVKRSTDGGRTWTNPVTVAEGDGSTEAKYGYGDPALVRTLSGNIICLMAAGSKGFGQGQNHVGMVTSTDGGQTWTPVVDITTRSGKWTNNPGTNDFFVTSGKGLCTDDGVLMFLIDADRSSEKNYLLYSTDDGESWTIDGNLVYGAANGAVSNEAKLEQMNDGSLLASVRQDGNRGWNTATYTKNANGTVTFNWGKQYRTSDISGNSCNADILYYSRTTKGAKRDILLHSYINSSGRESLQLSMSIDGGKSWHDVYNIQPNGSCYSTMQKLNDGTLAIFIEDESYSAGNGYAINFITVTKEQIENWCDELENVGVKIVEKGNLNNNAPFGSWNPSTNWANQFTTSAASGTAGVVVSATYNGLNRQYLNGSGTQRVFVMKPSAANAQNDVFTITAPEGYVITGYTIGGYKNAEAENYTLTAENGESVAINILNTSSNQPNYLSVTGINSKSTTFTMSNSNSANSSFASISHFIVYLKEINKSITLTLLDDDRGAEYPNEDRISDNLDAATADVTLFGRTLYKDESWNTLCLPFAVNSFDGTPLEDAEVRTLQSASFSNGTLTLNFTDGLDAMEAGKPYIVRWDSGDDLKNPEFTGVQLSDATPELNFDNIGMIFKGVYSPFAFEAQDKSKLYMGNANTLYYPKKAMTIKAFRAFFDLGSNLMAAEPSTNAGAKEITNFVLNFGETTSLNEELRMKSEESVGDWYSIDGRRLQGEPTAKGVYIHKGKKVIK